MATQSRAVPVLIALRGKRFLQVIQDFCSRVATSCSCRVATSCSVAAARCSCSCQCWPFALIVARLNAKLTDRQERAAVFHNFHAVFSIFHFSFSNQIESFRFVSFHFIAIWVDFRNVSCGRWIVSCFLVVPAAAAAPAEIICNFSFLNASGVGVQCTAKRGRTETKVASDLKCGKER